MNLDIKEIAIGAALAVATLVAFRIAGIHREKGTYAVLLAAITAPYVISSFETGEADALKHSVIALAFAMLAMAGAMRSLWLIVLGFAAHAIFDGVLHYSSLLAPTPGWYGPVCLGYDLIIAAGLAGFLIQGESPAEMR